MNKMPLSNVDINLTSQTPGGINRVRQISMEGVDPVDISFEKKYVTPTFEKGLVIEKVASEGRENAPSAFKSKIAARSRQRPLGSH